MIVTLTMNPAIDKTGYIEEFELNKLNRLEDVYLTIGGKGINVSRTLESLGYKSKCISFLPKENGAFLKQELQQALVEECLIEVEGRVRTNMKIVSQGALTEINESGFEVNSLILDTLSKTINESVQEEDILVISGSVPKGTPKDYYQKLIHKMKEMKVKTLLDADGELFKEGLKALPTIIKPNVYELCQYFGLDETISEKEIITYASKWIHDGIELVVVSMGEQGSLYISNELILKAHPLKLDVASSVGAGDALVAAIAYAYEHDYKLKKLAQLAAATSSAAVTTKATIAPSKDMIDTLMKQVKITEN